MIQCQDEGHITETQNKTFRRREIASNWAKYEIPPDDGTATARGQDFNKLLQAAGRRVITEVRGFVVSRARART